MNQHVETIVDNNLSWVRDAIDQAKTLIRPGQTYTGEEIRFALTDRGFPEPHHPNLWGALINSLKRTGALSYTGEFRPMTGKRSHGRITPVYLGVA